MKNIKTWIKPTRNKIILLALITLAIGALIFSLPLFREDIPVVVFKENIIFEYGDSTSTSTFDMKSYNDVLSGKAESDAQIINAFMSQILSILRNQTLTHCHLTSPQTIMRAEIKLTPRL